MESNKLLCDDRDIETAGFKKNNQFTGTSDVPGYTHTGRFTAY